LLKNNWSACIVQSELSAFISNALPPFINLLKLVPNHIYKIWFFYSLVDFYEMHIEFLNFVITKLEYRQKSGHSLSRYDCLEPSWRYCVVLLSEFMLICARSWWLSSLYFRIIKWTSNRDGTCNHDENI
jgi:hypothetical protein